MRGTRRVVNGCVGAPWCGGVWWWVVVGGAGKAIARLVKYGR